MDGAGASFQIFQVQVHTAPNILSNNWKISTMYSKVALDVRNTPTHFKIFFKNLMNLVFVRCCIDVDGQILFKIWNRFHSSYQTIYSEFCGQECLQIEVRKSTCLYTNCTYIQSNNNLLKVVKTRFLQQGIPLILDHSYNALISHKQSNYILTF